MEPRKLESRTHKKVCSRDQLTPLTTTAALPRYRHSLPTLTPSEVVRTAPYTTLNLKTLFTRIPPLLKEPSPGGSERPL